MRIFHSGIFIVNEMKNRLVSQVSYDTILVQLIFVVRERVKRSASGAGNIFDFTYKRRQL